jgi:hypothetical protein
VQLPFEFFILLLIAGVIVIIGIGWYRGKKRTEALESTAKSLMFSFSKQPKDFLLPSLSHFKLFSKGRSKKILNVMNGSVRDVDVTIFDYHYTIGSGTRSNVHRQTVALFKSNELQLPYFTLQPESLFDNLFDKVGSVFGRQQDIDFDSHPAFSSRYRLQAPDEQACRDVFTDRILDHYDKRIGLCTEADADNLIFYRFNKNVLPDDIRSFLDEGFGIFNLFKIGAW